MNQLPDYSGFKEEFEVATEVETIDYGELGYTIDGKYSVFVKNNPSKYNVRLRDGTLIEALHKGSVPPVPDLPVKVDYDQFNRPFIVAPDETQILAFASNQGTNSYMDVGFHTHHRGSGMEFPMDWRLLYQFNPQISDDYTINVRPGWLEYNRTMVYFPGEAYDLRSLLPLSNGFTKWVVFYLDPTTTPASLLVVAGTEVATLTGLTVSALTDIIDITDGRISLFAVKLNKPSTRIEDRNIESLPPFISSGTSDGQRLLTEYGELIIDSNGSFLTE